MASRSNYPGTGNALIMRNQQQIQHGFGNLRLLFRCIILLAVWHQCRGINYEYKESCSQDAATPPDNCSAGFYMIVVRDCPKYFCYRKLNEICYPGDDTTRCAPGQVCSCNKCMNCSGAICHMELCPNNYPYVYKKRLSNRLLPWIYRGRLQNVSQKIVEPNYDD